MVRCVICNAETSKPLKDREGYSFCCEKHRKYKKYYMYEAMRMPSNWSSNVPGKGKFYGFEFK